MHPQDYYNRGWVTFSNFSSGIFWNLVFLVLGLLQIFLLRWVFHFFSRDFFGIMTWPTRPLCATEYAQTPLQRGYFAYFLGPILGLFAVILQPLCGPIYSPITALP